MIRHVFRTSLVRVNGERGSVGVLVALAMFFVMGLLVMTFNTAQLSKEKMRLQTAVDAAALEHAAWQARGMNMVQNLNNEAFTALCFADELIGIACGVDKLRAFFVPFLVTPAAVVVKPLETMAYFIVRGIFWVAKYVAKGLVEGVIKIFQDIVAFSPLIGYLEAQQLAVKNGSDALIDLGKIGDYSFSFNAFGISSGDLLTLFRLPVKRDDMKRREGESDKDFAHRTEPFTTKNSFYRTLLLAVAANRAPAYTAANVVPEFNFAPMVSKTREKPAKGQLKWVLPAPTLWMCWKQNKRIKLLPFDLWDTGYKANAWKSKTPKRFTDGHGGVHRMLAIAAAQCITGDVVCQSLTAGGTYCQQRPGGLGTGATAKLVPVENVIGVMGHLIYH